MAETQKNLAAGFAGESQAHLRYQEFARKATKEGHPHIANLFRTIAEAEDIHGSKWAGMMYKNLDTAGALKEAMGGEHYETTQMYPGFEATAREEGEKGAAALFSMVGKVEAVHEGHYKAALAALEEGIEVDGKFIFLCPVCGNIEIVDSKDAKPYEKCPICNLKWEKWQLIE